MSENPPTAVDSSIIAEIIAGETASWPVGLCEIAGEREVMKGHYKPILPGHIRKETPDRIVAYGENGHAIAVEYLPKSPSSIAEVINRAIAEELRAL